MSINAKREKYRDEIRKKQREAFFLQERMKNISVKNQNLAIQQHIVQQLFQKHNVQANLDAVLNIVRSNHNYPVIISLIQKGLIPALVFFLRGQEFPRKTLEILSFLIQYFSQKPHSFDLCRQLYEYGFFQSLVNFLDLKQGGVLSTYILYCFSEASQDYCEAIFQSEIYKILIGQLIHILNTSPYIQVNSQTEEYRFCVHILRILQNLAALKNSFDYSSQKHQMWQIIEFCLVRRLFLRNVFGVIYEIILAEQKDIAIQNLVHLINQIMGQVDLGSDFMQNMFATIYRLIPHPSLDYSLVFQTGIKNSKTYKIMSYILEELVKKQKLQFIPTGEIFWEKFIINGSLKDEEIFKRCIKVISKINLEISLFCRIIAVALEYQHSFHVQREGLDVLENFLKDKHKIELKLAEINKHNIPDLLQNFEKCENSKLKDRAAWILDYILGPMTDMSSRIESL